MRNCGHRFGLVVDVSLIALMVAGAMGEAASAATSATRPSSSSAPAAVHARKTAKPAHAAAAGPVTGSRAVVAAPVSHDPIRATSSESMVVTGSRGSARKVTESLSPIDVVSAQQIASTGQTDLTAALSLVNPSISTQSRQTTLNALTSSFRLRGLNPDQTLVLVDGKRRHTTANINADAGPESGEMPVDIDMIPVSMIDHIEVLRDGASAQYGSDAIAGVVNIVLKKSATRGSQQGMVGANYKGDGFNYSLRGDHGFELGEDGYLHIGMDFMHTDRTVRDGMDTRTHQYDFRTEGKPNLTRENIAMDWGKSFMDEKLTFYGNVIYGHKNGQVGQFFRVASTLPEYYPNGFVPLITSNEDDYSATLGIKGRDLLGFAWDLSTTYGSDNVDIGMKNSANVSFYHAYGWTPTNFKERSFQATQWTNNLDIHRSFAVPGFAKPLTLAFGAEHRLESYRIVAGEPASYFGTGSQALVGLTPNLAGQWYRDVYAGYVDVDIQPIKHLDIDFAGRFEHYTDAGDAKIGKVAARYDFTNWIAVRGAINTGFRAPTLGQEHYGALSVAPTFAQGQLAVSSAAAGALGAVPLTPEFSTNASGGIVLRPIKNLNITADVYQINIRDRIINGGSYSGADAVNAIAEMGSTIPAGIAPGAVTARYYSNGASTRTQGADIVASYLTDLHEAGRIDWNLGISLNRTRLTHLANDTNGNPLLTAQGISYLTTVSPRSKILMSGRWTWKKLDVYVQEIRWGQTKDMATYYSGPYTNSNSVFFPFVSNPKWITNVEFGYRVAEKVHVAVGANNLFNNHPTRLPSYGRYAGAEMYDNFVGQMDINGGYYYLRVNSSF